METRKKDPKGDFNVFLLDAKVDSIHWLMTICSAPLASITYPKSDPGVLLLGYTYRINNIYLLDIACVDSCY